MRKVRLFILPLTIIAGWLTAIPAQSAWDKWTAGSGIWTNAANWDGGVPGGSSVIAVIDNGGTATIDSPIDQFNRIVLGSDIGRTGTVIMTEGARMPGFNWNNQAIARGGTGTLIMNGGSWNGSAKLHYIGESTNAVGNWTINAGTVSNLSFTIGGDRAYGLLLINGTNALATGFSGTSYIGYTNSAYGRVCISNGVWSGNSKNIELGSYANATGVLTMTGGVLTGAGSITVGSHANGRIELSGSALVNSNGTLYVGRYAGSYGTVNQRGGTCNLNNRQIRMANEAGSYGEWNLSGGVLTNCSILMVGYAGEGRLTISESGVCSLGGTLKLGAASGATGRVEQTGGAIRGNNKNIFIGYATNAVGIYRISDGIITNVNNLHCGISGAGTLEISGNQPSINVTDFQINSNSTLRVTPALTAVSTINAANDTTLAGRLEVDLTNFEKYRRTLTIIKYGDSLSGTFDTVEITPGWVAEIDYTTPGEVRLANIQPPSSGTIVIAR